MFLKRYIICLCFYLCLLRGHRHSADGHSAPKIPPSWECRQILLNAQNFMLRGANYQKIHHFVCEPPAISSARCIGTAVRRDMSSPSSAAAEPDAHVPTEDQCTCRRCLPSSSKRPGVNLSVNLRQSDVQCDTMLATCLQQAAGRPALQCMSVRS